MNQDCQCRSFIEQYDIDIDTSKKLLGLCVEEYRILIRTVYSRSDKNDITIHLINNHDFNINHKDYSGQTILHDVMYHPHIGFLIGLIELLLNHGADPTILDRFNQTPLDLYKNCNEIIDEDIIKLLDNYTWSYTKEPECD